MSLMLSLSTSLRKPNVVWGFRNSAPLLNVAVLVFTLFAGVPSKPKPLWPGAHYTDQGRELAVERGLQFLYRIASNPQYFSRWGSDLVFCFYTISNTAKDARLRELSRKMGQDLARKWRLRHPDPPTGNPVALQVFLHGANAADKLLAAPAPDLKRRIQDIAQRFSAIDFLMYDPRREPPPADIPELCPKCKHQNPRGATVCQKCQSALTFRNAYDVWLDSLIFTHDGDVYGVTLGSPYPEVLQWITRMRPYPASAEDEDKFDDVSYAVTHVIYTLNNYHEYRLSPAWLPDEFRYLKNNIGQALSYENGELLGEFMDALRAFGEDESDPAMQAGMTYLLSHQNPDGSWGDTDDDDIYTRYHSTWTAVDGLRQYSFHGERMQFPQMLPLLQGKPAVKATQTNEGAAQSKGGIKRPIS